MFMRRAVLWWTLAISACRPSVPVRTGPLPAAHSCFLMTGALLQPVALPASAATWLLLSDQSAKRFGARDFDALSLDGGVTTAARWHRVTGDSLRVEWTAAAQARIVVFHETADGIRGLAPMADDASAQGRTVEGRRVDCALLASG
jgi:hypothetical protein